MARKKKAAPKENAERWLLTYADLITLLMVFFVLLFSMSHTDAAKFQALSASLHSAFNPSIFSGGGGKQVSTAQAGGSNDSIVELQEFTSVKQTIQALEKQAKIPSQQTSTVITKEGIAITVSGVLLFYNGTDQIKPDGIVLLQQIGETLKNIPNSIRVEGHTDDIAAQDSPYPTNWELSSARATGVVRFFTDTVNLAPSRLSAVGFGQYQPIVPNDSREHRETNRRAVIVILYGSSASNTGVTPTATP